jgi:hypothetical protein
MKRRPALVIAALTGDDLVLCQITSQARADEYSIRLEGADFVDGGSQRTMHSLTALRRIPINRFTHTSATAY